MLTLCDKVNSWPEDEDWRFINLGFICQWTFIYFQTYTQLEHLIRLDLYQRLSKQLQFQSSFSTWKRFFCNFRHVREIIKVESSFLIQRRKSWRTKMANSHCLQPEYGLHFDKGDKWNFFKIFPWGYVDTNLYLQDLDGTLACIWEFCPMIWAWGWLLLLPLTIVTSILITNSMK